MRDLTFWFQISKWKGTLVPRVERAFNNVSRVYGHFSLHFKTTQTVVFPVLIPFFQMTLRRRMAPSCCCPSGLSTASLTLIFSPSQSSAALGALASPLPLILTPCHSALARLWRVPIGSPAACAPACVCARLAALPPASAHHCPRASARLPIPYPSLSVLL